jgi:hypothetical protein
VSNQDKIAAAVIAFVGSIFPVLNLTGAVKLTSDDISIVMLCVTQAVTLGGLLFQSVKKPSV